MTTVSDELGLTSRGTASGARVDAQEVGELRATQLFSQWGLAGCEEARILVELFELCGARGVRLKTLGLHEVLALDTGLLQKCDQLWSNPSGCSIKPIKLGAELVM